ncbi:tRNA-uridine aminocarboxypropyltransferase [Microbulbifer pacificus]|uniref:tRNA-uridine aminocarboxypropyltransferase n=1 Tax=Microbulbifer pacificus TaxID=407164 RepID=A0AAU0MVZ3_9GAMM|nr:tRNA-uridine aminocarboxypropyltransferase [Microbulbifer pacificus]WOX04350.1 tRNA-uridine aminocarboxypropyltransferase [Microbulbifer pacificus]
MQIILLTHERELERPSNTGKLVLSAVAGEGVGVERVIWRRAEPDKALLATLDDPAMGLLYPDTEVAGEAAGNMSIETCERFILLDATWQEARKMFNRSPYLHLVRRVNLVPARDSRFRLRRNQKSAGLCTVECVVEILRCKGHLELAALLEEEFERFNSAN